MKLLSTRNTISIVEFYGRDIPPYAILSHTWTDGEILLQELQDQEVANLEWEQVDDLHAQAQGFFKLQRTAALARSEGFDFVWVDTCCIDKTSSAELSEAINSMYRWYQGAQVDFYARDWSYLGSRDRNSIDFTHVLHEITGVQLGILTGEDAVTDVSIASRMRWAASRETTRVEDMAYCLLGLFDVHMPLLYGEGARAFIRLQEAILLRDDDQSLFAWYTDDGPDEQRGADAVAIEAASRPLSLSGLLADSPRRFLATGDIETAMSSHFFGGAASCDKQGTESGLAPSAMRRCRGRRRPGHSEMPEAG
ncbi:hypothetical protein VTH82DRAFT_8183 [Thermothelomyces myriococcoides]